MFVGTMTRAIPDDDTTSAEFLPAILHKLRVFQRLAKVKKKDVFKRLDLINQALTIIDRRLDDLDADVQNVGEMANDHEEIVSAKPVPPGTDFLEARVAHIEGRLKQLEDQQNSAFERIRHLESDGRDHAAVTEHAGVMIQRLCQIVVVIANGIIVAGKNGKPSTNPADREGLIAKIMSIAEAPVPRAAAKVPDSTETLVGSRGLNGASISPDKLKQIAESAKELASIKTEDP